MIRDKIHDEQNDYADPAICNMSTATIRIRDVKLAHRVNYLELSARHTHVFRGQ